MKRGLLIGGVIFTLSVFAAPALAAPVLDFGTGFAGAGGIVTYDLNTGYITGTGIGLDVLVVSGSGNDGVYDLSGPLSRGTTTFANLAFNSDPNSNFITVTGGIQSLGIADNTVLLTGTIDSFHIYDNGTILAISELTGSDTKDPGLLQALGISATPFTFLGFNISAKDLEGQYVAHSTDILNTPVPIPSAILLLGGGLAGLAVFRRRMRV